MSSWSYFESAIKTLVKARSFAAGRRAEYIGPYFGDEVKTFFRKRSTALCIPLAWSHGFNQRGTKEPDSMKSGNGRLYWARPALHVSTTILFYCSTWLTTAHLTVRSADRAVVFREITMPRSFPRN
jgi:hypothetical protein